MRDSRHYGTVKDQDMTKINHHMMMIPVILCEYSLYDAYNQDKHFYVSVIQTWPVIPHMANILIAQISAFSAAYDAQSSSIRLIQNEE